MKAKNWLQQKLYKFKNDPDFLRETIKFLEGEIAVYKNNEKVAIESLRLCCIAIKAIHPVLNPDEPCIAFEAHESARRALDKIG